MKGTIKTLTDRGYGFIAPDEGGDDLFFHANNLVGVEFDRLQVGDEVEFEVTESEKGPNAADVEMSSGDDADTEADEAPAADPADEEAETDEDEDDDETASSIV